MPVAGSKGRELWQAVHERDHPAAIALLANNADINWVNDQDLTPIMEAARIGNDIIIPHLIVHGAHPTAKNKHGDSALMLALSNAHLVCAEKLIIHGADLDKLTDVPHEKLNKLFEHLLMNHRADLIFNLLEPLHALDYDLTFSDRGHTLLQIAITEGDAVLVENILNARVPVSSAEIKLAISALEYYKNDAKQF